MGKVVIFSAPNGSGKTTIVRELLKRFPQFEFSVSATSRAPRGCERHGCDYHFMTHEEFMQAVAENRFVEWEEVYKGTCYGTLRSEVERIWAKGNIIVFDVDVIGGINLKRIFGGDACSIFVMPPSVEELRRRLEGRGTDAPEVIDRRVAKAEFELTKAPEFDHIVVNDSLDEAIAETTYKRAAELAPEMDRFEMAERACAASRLPERIKPSVVEFLLPKPSYTIDTLRYLTENHGAEMEFSILMGADQLERLDGWKEYEKILEYPIYVYPRHGEQVGRFAGRITVLEDAPLQDFSSTEVRGRIERGEDVSQMLDAGVAEYIRRKGLWSPAARKAALTAQIAAEPENTELYTERGKLHYRLNEWGAALNDFNRVLQLDDSHAEARQYAQMVQEILEFRYKDIYNP